MRAGARRAVWCAGAVYLAAGVVAGSLAGGAASPQARLGWRWAAWAVSALAFGAHIAYERAVLRSGARGAALRVSSGAGIGAFGLAVAADLHALQVPPHRSSALLVASLVIWPVLVMLPAFAVALGAAALLGRIVHRADA